MVRETQPESAGAGGRWLHPVALAALGVAGLAVAAWLLQRDPAWRLGEAVWPEGLGFRDAVLPMGVTRGMTWALLAAWLGLGPAALVRAARPWAWCIALGVNVLVLAFAGWWLVLLGVVVLFALALDPRWLPRRVPGEPEVVFYDGGCGLCHRWVRRLAVWDGDGELYRYAPLDGRTATSLMTPAQRDALPDSVVLRTGQGRLLTRSAAAVHMLDQLGGWPRVAAWALSLLPAPLRDFGYDRVAAVRHKLFKKPDNACPFASPELRERFLP